MVTNIYVNLPVTDIDRSIEFFTRMGFTFNRQFTDKNAACLVLGEHHYAMLILTEFMTNFTAKPIHDASKATEVIVALQVETRQQVDELADRAAAAGAGPSKTLTQMDFMYVRNFEDLDGHLWEIFWMDPKAMSGK